MVYTRPKNPVILGEILEGLLYDTSDGIMFVIDDLTENTIGAIDRLVPKRSGPKRVIVCAATVIERAALTSMNNVPSIPIEAESIAYLLLRYRTAMTADLFQSRWAEINAKVMRSYLDTNLEISILDRFITPEYMASTDPDKYAKLRSQFTSELASLVTGYLGTDYPYILDKVNQQYGNVFALLSSSKFPPIFALIDLDLSNVKKFINTQTIALIIGTLSPSDPDMVIWTAHSSRPNENVAKDVGKAMPVVQKFGIMPQAFKDFILNHPARKVGA